MNKSNNRITVVRVLFSREMAVIVGMSALLGILGNIECEDEKKQEKVQIESGVTNTQPFAAEDDDTLSNRAVPLYSSHPQP